MPCRYPRCLRKGNSSFSPKSRNVLAAIAEYDRNIEALCQTHHHASVRALAFKWIRIIWKCWQTRTPYNELLYLESLRKSGSPLLKFIASHHL